MTLRSFTERLSWLFDFKYARFSVRHFSFTWFAVRCTPISAFIESPSSFHSSLFVRLVLMKRVFGSVKKRTPRRGHRCLSSALMRGSVPVMARTPCRHFCRPLWWLKCLHRKLIRQKRCVCLLCGIIIET